MNIGFIGLGIMGKPMAGHLIAGGHTAYLYSRSGVAQELLDAGGKGCASPAEVANNADIIFTYDDQLGTLFVEAAHTDDDVQDFGYTGSLDEVDWAPEVGWSSVGWSELILGHSYIIWTGDNRYAKIRVIEIGETWLRFDWAHQEDPGNPELKPVVPDSLIAGVH